MAAGDAHELRALVGLERRHRPPAAHRDRGGDVGHLERGGLDHALADRGRADREVVSDLARGRDRALGGARDRRGLVEAEPLGDGDQPLAAELGARAARTPSCTRPRTRSGTCRRSPRRWRCGGCSRRASPRCCTGKTVVSFTIPACERAGGGDDLHRRAGRLER